MPNDGTKTYRALNGHMMTYWVDDDGNLERGYAWQAWHSDECPCETGGADIGDW